MFDIFYGAKLSINKTLEIECVPSRLISSSVSAQKLLTFEWMPCIVIHVFRQVQNNRKGGYLMIFADYFCQFFIKTYAREAILMSTDNIGFYEEILVIKYPVYLFY